MSRIFVTSDGTWGDAEDLRIFDTTNWTDEQFEEFDNANDNSKLELAEEFSQVDCPKCGEKTSPEAIAQWEMCHDCDNQSCPECGEIDCDHEF
jgi:predicted RNA-binding Zn-ribbon protein involved in translation (DUF1610 family)